MNHDNRRAVLLAAAAVLAACGDPFDPILTPVPPAADVELVDFVGGDLVDPAAFDMLSRSPVRTDQTNGWDFLFIVDETDGPQLIPRGALLDIETEAGLQVEDEPFDGIDDVPDDDYVTDGPVPIEVGTVLAMISRTNPTFSIRCRLYGKAVVTAIDGSPARLSMTVVVNPNCEERDVEVSEDDE